MIGVHRNTVFEMIRRGVLVKVKIQGTRAWQVTVESVDDYLATRGMSISELSTRVVQLERLVRKVLKKARVGPALPSPEVIEDLVEEEHDHELVQQVLRKYHPERYLN